MGWFGGAGRRMHLCSQQRTFPGRLRALPLTAAPLVRVRSIPLPTGLAASPFGSDALRGAREQEPSPGGSMAVNRQGTACPNG